MVIESLVAVLLVLTIGYCMLLNKRLKRLKAHEQSQKAAASPSSPRARAVICPS